MVHGTAEIAVLGEKWAIYLKDVLHLYLPHKVVVASEHELEAFPLLRGKGQTTHKPAFLCQNYACRQPVTTLAAFESLILSNNHAINNK